MRKVKERSNGLSPQQQAAGSGDSRYANVAVTNKYMQNEPTTLETQVGDEAARKDGLSVGPSSPEFLQQFKKDIDKLSKSPLARELIRYLQTSEASTEVTDVSDLWISSMTNKEIVQLSNTIAEPQGMRLTAQEDGIIAVDYRGYANVSIDGITASSELVLLHELVHAKDIASGYFAGIMSKIETGEINVGMHYDTPGYAKLWKDLAEIRAMIYANTVRKELGSSEIRTHYKGIQVLFEDGITPVQDFGFDVTEGLFRKPEQKFTKKTFNHTRQTANNR